MIKSLTTDGDDASNPEPATTVDRREVLYAQVQAGKRLWLTIKGCKFFLVAVGTKQAPVAWQFRQDGTDHAITLDGITPRQIESLYRQAGA